ncbi:MAG TPA: dephospho-CoA kinase [Thermoanaerobacterales bacterium]|nr:dephospho-CoA kinase [Thermoanaerobacterales bacterium]
MRTFKVIGLTGGIASGKSTVSNFLKQLGAYIIDADIVSRHIIEPGSIAWREIVENFGDCILKEDQKINRKVLGDIVFSSEEKLLLLNSITHPKIIKRIEELLLEAKKTHDIIVIDAALLIELEMQDMVDEVWVVDIDTKTQLERLSQREGITKEHALNRVNAQLPNEKRLKHGDKIIDNNGTFEKTKQQVIQLWKELR